MGSRFKKSLVSENVRHSLHQWKRRVKTKPSTSSSAMLLGETSLSSSVLTTENCSEGSTSSAAQHTQSSQLLEQASSDSMNIQISVSSGPVHVTSNNKKDEGNEDRWWKSFRLSSWKLKRFGSVFPSDVFYSYHHI